jgi:hypothetical protein
VYLVHVSKQPFSIISSVFEEIAHEILYILNGSYMCNTVSHRYNYPKTIRRTLHSSVHAFSVSHLLCTNSGYEVGWGSQIHKVL